MKKLLLSLALLCVAVSTVQAQDVYQWFGSPDVTPKEPTTNWNSATAWMIEYYAADNTTMAGTRYTCPDAYAKVKLNNVLWGPSWENTSIIIGGVNGTQNISVGDVFMVDYAPLTPEYLTVATGGSLFVQGATDLLADGQINIAYASGGVAALRVLGGSVVVDGTVHVGWGGNGSVLINGGSLAVRAFDFGGSGGSGLIDIRNGSFIVDGIAAYNQVNGLIALGKIVNGYNGELTVTYDENADKTIVTPEPISLALLGLGALLMRKRS